MNWKECGRKQSWHNLRYYAVIPLEGLRGTVKNISQDSQFADQDLKAGSSEYIVGVLTTLP
jgi:hypothetical protein